MQSAAADWTGLSRPNGADAFVLPLNCGPINMSLMQKLVNGGKPVRNFVVNQKRAFRKECANANPNKRRAFKVQSCDSKLKSHDGALTLSLSNLAQFFIVETEQRFFAPIYKNDKPRASFFVFLNKKSISHYYS